MDSHWCSFIPHNFLSALANDNSLNEDLRESVQETINTGNSLFSNATSSTITDNGDRLLSRILNNEPVSAFEVPHLLDSEMPERKGGLIRLIYNADGQEVVPGRNAKQVERDIRDRERWDTIWENVTKIHAFFDEQFGHELFSKERLTVAVTMNYGHKYMNAHWTGKRVILGSGDAGFLDDFDKAVDVIAHEITHGVILRTSGLKNFGEPGALSEHLADVFGLLYKHYEINPDQNAADCIWTIGESLWSPPDGFFQKYATSLDPALGRKFWLKVGGKIADNHSRHDPTISTDVTPEQALTFKKLPRYLRSFSDPTSTMPAQPIHYDDYANLKTDNGGVHHNSGIGNYAFYIAAIDAGDPPLNGVGKIWFRAMTDGNVGENCTFARFAAFALAYAKRDYKELIGSVKKGWEMVGVQPDEVEDVLLD